MGGTDFRPPPAFGGIVEFSLRVPAGQRAGGGTGPWPVGTQDQIFGSVPVRYISTSWAT